MRRYFGGGILSGENNGWFGKRDLMLDFLVRAQRVRRRNNDADREESEVENGDPERGGGEDESDVSFGKIEFGD